MNGRVFVVIIRKLNSRGFITASELASELEVSTRTIYRYVNELTACGIPINSKNGRYGGFFLDNDYNKSNYKIKV